MLHTNCQYRSKRRLLALPLVAAVFAILAPASAAQTAEYPWTIEELGDGIFAFLHPHESRLDDSNSTVIVGTNEVVVVDSQSNPAATQAVIDWIREHTAAPVTVVINTHWHRDHNQNNVLYKEAFGDDVEFIGHATLPQDMVERTAAALQQEADYYREELPGARERLEQGVFRDGSPMSDLDKGEARATIIQVEAWLATNGDVAWVPPTRTYGARQRLRRAGRSIDLIHFGAHTRGDTVVWLPESGVAATGDMLDDMPYGGHGYPSAWKAALEDLRELPIEATIPGHGPVFRDSAKLDAIHAFLEELIAQVGAAVADGASLEETQTRVQLPEARDRLAGDEMSASFFEQVLPEAVERAWLEARGEIE